MGLYLLVQFFNLILNKKDDKMKKICIGITVDKNVKNLRSISKLCSNKYRIAVYVVMVGVNEERIIKAKEMGINVIHTDKYHRIASARNLLLDKAIEEGHEFITFAHNDDYVDCLNLSYIEEQISANTDFGYANNYLVRNGISNIIEVINDDFTEAFASEDLANIKNYDILFEDVIGRIYNLNLIKEKKLKFISEKKFDSAYEFNYRYKEHARQYELFKEHSFYHKRIVNIIARTRAETNFYESRFNAINHMLTLYDEQTIKRIIVGNFIKLNENRFIELAVKRQLLKQISIINPNFQALVNELIKRLNSHYVESIFELQNTSNRYQQGLTIVVIGAQSITSIRRNPNFFSGFSNIEIIASSAIENIARIIDKSKFNNILFFNDDFDLSEFAITELITDLDDLDTRDQAYTFALDYPLSIRSGSYFNLQLNENLFNNNGNLFWGTIFNTRKLARLTAKTEKISNPHWKFITYVTHHQLPIKLIANYNINCYTVHENDEPLDYLSDICKRDTIATISRIGEIVSNSKYATNRIVSQPLDNYQILTAKMLSEKQEQYINYQMHCIESKFYDGAYFVNEAGEIAGLAMFDNQKQININKLVQLDGCYTNRSEQTLFDVISNNEYYFAHQCAHRLGQIEGYYQIEFGIDDTRIVVHDRQKQKITNPVYVLYPRENSEKSYRPGLTLITIGTVVSDSIKKLIAIESIQHLNVSRTNFNQELASKINKIEFENTLLIDGGATIDSDFDGNLLSVMVNDSTPLKIMQVKVGDKIVPDVAFSKEMINEQYFNQVSGMCIQSQLLTIRALENSLNIDPVVYFMQTLIERHQFKIYKYNGFVVQDVLVNRSSQRFNQWETIYSQNEFGFNQKLASLFATEINIGKEPKLEVGKWLYRIEEDTQKVYSIEYLLQNVDRTTFSGVYLTNKYNQITNILPFCKSQRVNIQNMLKLPITTIQSPNVISDLEKFDVSFNNQSGHVHRYINNFTKKLVIVCPDFGNMEEISKILDTHQLGSSQFQAKLKEVHKRFNHYPISQNKQCDYLYLADDYNQLYSFFTFSDRHPVFKQVQDELEAFIVSNGYTRENVTIIGTRKGAHSARLLAHNSELIGNVYAIDPIFNLDYLATKEDNSAYRLTKQILFGTQTRKDITTMLNDTLMQHKPSVNEFLIIYKDSPFYEQIMEYENYKATVYVCDKQASVKMNEIYELILAKSKNREFIAKNLYECDLLDVQAGTDQIQF